MLVTIIAWIYISFICRNWGALFISLLGKSSSSNFQYNHLSIDCFVGLAVVSVIAQVVSLFAGFGHWFVQLIFLIPAIVIEVYFNKKKMHTNAAWLWIKAFSRPLLFLTLSLLLLILIMSVYDITHPDTLAYHANIISWTNQYKAIPGLAQLDYHLGFQSAWYILCSLFSFSFTGSHALTFVNSTAVVWYIIFIVQKINDSLKQPGVRPVYFSFLWLLLLTINIWSYTQIRLLVSSGSPDFIAALYILLTAYLFIGKLFSQKSNMLLIVFLSLFAVTIKLSALPVLLFVLFIFFMPGTKQIGWLIALFFITLAPYVTRNIIVSGYPFFPLDFPDIANVSWKYPHEKLKYIHDYILAMARTQDVHEGIQTVLHQPFSTWIKAWWRYLSSAEICMLIVLLASVVLSFIKFRRIFSVNKKTIFALTTALCGIIFWFFNAPDIRFGMGFIILYCALILPAMQMPEWIYRIIVPRTIAWLCIAGCCITFSYFIYRCIYYSRTSQIIAPTGIPSSFYQPSHYNKTAMFLPDSMDSTRAIILRGASIEDGFIEKK